MKAAVYHGPRDIRVEDVSRPQIADNEMLVRVEACGICGSDLQMYRLGMFEVLGRPIDNGRIMGHELSGEVVEIGAEVTGFKIGDRITGVGGGGFAEYVPVPVTERSPHLWPEVISFDDGAQSSPNQGLTMLKQQHGRLVLVALFERQPELDFNQVIRKHVSLQGSWTWTGDICDSRPAGSCD